MSSVDLPQPSGSAKIYATASTKWVIPPKAKPGRKPKAVLQDDLDFEDNDPTEPGKKSQNRSAQRAFRERRQSQLSELQARIKQFEQGEVEKLVTLQALGQRLKAENDVLREENRRLQEENTQLRARLDSVTGAPLASSAAVHSIDPATLSRGTKRGRGDSPAAYISPLKRLRIHGSPRPHVSSAIGTPSISSSSSSHDQESPMLYVADEHQNSMEIDEMGEEVKPEERDDGQISHNASSNKYSCGMCTSSLDCVCLQLGIQTGIEEASGNLETETYSSILDNLPPYQPSMPLPSRKTKEGLMVGPSKLVSASSSQNKTGCSGDPSNCSACADNAFGKAFCSALGARTCSCTTCQSLSLGGAAGVVTANDPEGEAAFPLSINPSVTQCCGDPDHCKGGACTPTGVPPTRRGTARSAASGRRTRNSTKLLSSDDAADPVPVDVVWKALQAHPNAYLANPTAGPSHLANLNLLADVVARRSNCTLAPGEPTPEPEDFPKRTRPRNVVDCSTEAVKTLVTNPTSTARLTIAYEDDQMGEDQSPQERIMVPHEVLQSHQRITAVPKEGMRDAIALLDREFGCS